MVASVPGGPVQQAPRPRLVAKTASGPRSGTLKTNFGSHKHGPGGPDPMQVWNKNRRSYLPVDAL